MMTLANIRCRESQLSARSADGKIGSYADPIRPGYIVCMLFGQKERVFLRLGEGNALEVIRADAQ